MVLATVVTADLTKLSLSSATNADTEAENTRAADADTEMLSQIIQGYTTDPWFASANNVAQLDIYQGLYYKGDALAVPHIPEVKRTIMHELHVAKCKARG